MRFLMPFSKKIPIFALHYKYYKMANSVTDKYQLVVGLEVHVQLATKSKAFCGDAVKFGDPQNSHTSVISLAHPGTLPRLNKKQVEFAVKLGLALKVTWPVSALIESAESLSSDKLYSTRDAS